MPPPPTSKTGLTQAEKDKLNDYLTKLYNQYQANLDKTKDLLAANRKLDAEISSLKAQMNDAIEGGRKYSALELQLLSKQSEKESNSSLIREYTRRYMENQRKIDLTKSKLGRK